MSRYVIVDLEMCNVPAGKQTESFQLKNELIQIGAVLLDDNLEICDSFMTHVSPEYGSVDAFIEKLTGITREDTKDAPSAEQALSVFVAWMPDDAVPVSWSNSDELQIRKETESKGLSIPGLSEYLDRWVDCQKTFGERMNSSRAYKLSEALIIADIYYEDGEHDALVDARNTALLFAKMEREPELKLSPYYTNEVKEPPRYNPFAALLNITDSSD